MLFPPYIAQPCQLSCCRPMSSSVPRYNAASYNNNPHNAFRRRNSFSLAQSICNEDIDLDDCNDLIPPRPPEVRVTNSNSSGNSNELPKRLTSYEMIPLIKPASSMPNGLPNTQPLSPDMATSDELLLNDNTESHYRGSQPNIMMTSFRSNSSKGTNKADNISNLTASTTLASSTLSNLTSKSSNTGVSLGGGPGGGNSVSGSVGGGLGLNSYGNNMGSGPLGSSRYGGSRATSIEPRTTAYYYHELAQKSAVFDSNLNLLNDNKNESDSLPTTIADMGNMRQHHHQSSPQRQSQSHSHQKHQHPLPRQQQLSGSSVSHKLSSFNGSLDNVLETTRKNLDDLILGNSLLFNSHSSNDLLNCTNNGNSSSAGTLVDENLNLSYNSGSIDHLQQNSIHNNNNNRNPIPAARKHSSGYIKRSSQNLMHHSSSNSNILNSNGNSNNNGNNHHNNHSQSHHNEKYIA